MKGRGATRIKAEQAIFSGGKGYGIYDETKLADYIIRVRLFSEAQPSENI